MAHHGLGGEFIECLERNQGGRVSHPLVDQCHDTEPPTPRYELDVLRLEAIPDKADWALYCLVEGESPFKLSLLRAAQGDADAGCFAQCKTDSPL